MLRIIESAVAAEITIEGRQFVNFGGSSYLGLSGHPAIVAAGIDALRRHGAGAPIPRAHEVVTGPHRDAERAAAQFFGCEASLLLGGGYSLGLVTLAILRDEFDVVYYDELSHHALRDGIAASGLPAYAFSHMDTNDLARKIDEHAALHRRPLIATDGMFSTFGGIPPLADYLAVVQRYGGRLLIDESHSFGVIGETGRGAVEHHRLDPALVLRGGSLGKAFGTSGGVIPACSEEVERLRATPASRGATPGMPAAAAMVAASLRYVAEHPELLHQLRANTSYMKAGLRGLGLDVGDNIAPVATFATGTRDSMRALKARLLERGIFVYYTNYIGAGSEGAIRCTIFADHTREHIDLLLLELAQLL